MERDLGLGQNCSTWNDLISLSTDLGMGIALLGDAAPRDFWNETEDETSKDDMDAKGWRRIMNELQRWRR